MDTRPILVAEGVRKVYRSSGDEVIALHGLDLEVAQGEFVAVMGPSGSGKTTLLNCVSGLDEIDAGRVLVDGKSIHELSDAARTRHRAAEMGFIFQAFNLIPVFTATENVELPLLLVGRRCAASASGTGSTGGRPSFRAASSSGSRSRARSLGIRASSGRTSRPATSTRRWRTR
jgi:putative ABC transport system ATP-binding protein